MTDLEHAKKVLIGENCTCVLYRGDTIYKSDRRGVAPLMQLLDQGVCVRDFAAADRVVGKATAYLYCLLGVREVYAQVMSMPALSVLQAAGIPAEWGQLVGEIRNRQNDGPCPMEHATRDCETPEEALAAIRQTLRQLSQIRRENT